MRAIGLFCLLLGTLAFLFPFYDQYVRWLRLTTFDTQLLGGLFVAVGALTLAIHRAKD